MLKETGSGLVDRSVDQGPSRTDLMIITEQDEKNHRGNISALRMSGFGLIWSNNGAQGEFRPIRSACLSPCCHVVDMFDPDAEPQGDGLVLIWRGKHKHESKRQTKFLILISSFFFFQNSVLEILSSDI